ncbi:MAG: PilZ domain-containing protein [Phycisphaerales bacterium JB065]
MDTLAETLKRTAGANHDQQLLEARPTLMTSPAVPSIGVGDLLSAPDPSGWAGGVNRRRHGRVRCHGVKSSLGEVLDVSASGCKVKSRGRPGARVGEVIRITIHPQTSEPFEAYARVVWFRKVGIFQYHTGLCFEHITPEVRRGLAAIASAAVMHDGVWNG